MMIQRIDIQIEMMQGNSVPTGEILHILSDDEISFMNSEDFHPLTPGSVKWPYHPTRHL